MVGDNGQGFGTRGHGWGKQDRVGLGESQILRGPEAGLNFIAISYGFKTMGIFWWLKIDGWKG